MAVVVVKCEWSSSMIVMPACLYQNDDRSPRTRRKDGNRYAPGILDTNGVQRRRNAIVDKLERSLEEIDVGTPPSVGLSRSVGEEEVLMVEC